MPHCSLPPHQTPLPPPFTCVTLIPPLNSSLSTLNPSVFILFFLLKLKKTVKSTLCISAPPPSCFSKISPSCSASRLLEKA